MEGHQNSDLKPMKTKPELILITGNKGKLAEFNSILG